MRADVRRCSRRSGPLRLVPLLALTLTACVSPKTAETRIIDVLRARRTVSAATDSPHRIGSTAAAVYVRERTAFLASGNAEITIHTKSDAISVKLKWQAEPGAAEKEVGSAAALTEDGYFLTAAHCVEKMPMLLLGLGQGRLQSGAVRVVWRGDPAKGGPDVALIHAPIRGMPVFPLLAPREEPSSREVWAGGFGLATPAQVRGRLVSVGPWRLSPKGARWRELQHSAPLTPGDSGGPAVDLAGRLLGVHSTVEGWAWRLFGRDHVLSYRAEVVSPDLRWIESLIAKDRARRRR